MGVRFGLAPGSAAATTVALPGARRAAERAARPERTVLAFLAVCVALAALVNPTGPGHVAPVDVVMIACVFAVFLWALARAVTVRLPYVWPALGLMATGLLAAMMSVSPSSGLQAVIQEIYLVLWCAAVATVCRTPRALALILRVWAASAIAWACLLVLAVATGQKWLSGAGSVANGGGDLSGVSSGTRARLFFDHPNMAGNYFIVAIFIVLAAGFPKRIWARGAGCAVLALAVFLTGSNAAMLSLVVGLVLTTFLHIRARKGVVTATAVVMVVGGLLGIGWTQVVSPFLTTAAQSNNLLVRNSVGRGLRSAEARQSLFASQLQIFEKGDLLGIGPAVTKSTLGAEGAAAIHEAHNDYLGTLVERGPLGLTAVFALVAVVVVRLARFTTRPLPPRLAAALPLPAALAGACVAFALTALTHEILHYRWLWTLLGVVAAVHLLAQQAADHDIDVLRRATRGSRRGAARRLPRLPVPRGR